MKTLIARSIYWYGYVVGFIHITLRWHPWSPWTIAKLNMAWNHYIKTSMYEGRVKFDREIKGDGSFPLKTFVEQREYSFFLKQVTKKEWLKIIFFPFSCGEQFQMPFWKIGEWIGL
jgi:hypothetical protein